MRDRTACPHAAPPNRLIHDQPRDLRPRAAPDRALNLNLDPRPDTAGFTGNSERPIRAGDKCQTRSHVGGARQIPKLEAKPGDGLGIVCSRLAQQDI